MERVDILIIGGGIAGLSAAASMSQSARVVVLEREQHIGFHSSGRSATFYHFGIGNAAVRALTAASRAFFESPPTAFTDAPLCRATPAMFIATAAMMKPLAELDAAMRPFTDTVTAIGPAEIRSLVPVLRTGSDDIVAGLIDTGGRRLDGHRLLQGFAGALKKNGGKISAATDVTGIRRDNGAWLVATNQGEYRANIVVNAAGAWADEIATLAGVMPLGLKPLRRTIIVLDPPVNLPVSDWPFVKTAIDEFYMLPEAGSILASAVDEVPSVPTDAQPDDYDIALAAHRVEQYTTLTVGRIRHRWAGLRTFTHDRVPAVGFAPDVPGFFWLAGQGGFGLQTSPAIGSAATSLITGKSWPDALQAFGLMAEHLSPARLLQRSSSYPT